MRGVDLNTTSVYVFSVTHPGLTVAQRDTVVSFYGTNRLLEFTFDPPDDPYTYDCRFTAEPRRESDDGVWYDVFVDMKGTRV